MTISISEPPGNPCSPRISEILWGLPGLLAYVSVHWVDYRQGHISDPQASSFGIPAGRCSEKSYDNDFSAALAKDDWGHIYPNPHGRPYYLHHLVDVDNGHFGYLPQWDTSDISSRNPYLQTYLARRIQATSNWSKIPLTRWRMTMTLLRQNPANGQKQSHFWSTPTRSSLPSRLQSLSMAWDSTQPWTCVTLQFCSASHFTYPRNFSFTTSLLRKWYVRPVQIWASCNWQSQVHCEGSLNAALQI